MKEKIQIYDTTLRDGSQAEEVTFTVEDKLRIAEKLDGLGVSHIEAGWPGANPKDSEVFKRAVKDLKLKNAKLVAFGSTKKAGKKPEDDWVLQGLLNSQVKSVCIFGKTWDFHVKKTLRVPLEENLDMIESSIRYLKSQKLEVIYDAEHFFDGYKANPEYALKTLKAAKKGGADILVLCDTNGGTLPDEVTQFIKVVKSKVKTPLGIHCHNDSGVAVANSLAAVQAGAVQVQGTMNGIGERCGNANLCTIAANLELKMGYHCFGSSRMKTLKEVSLFVDELSNREPDRQQAYVGRSAFAHKGGVHVHAVLKDSKTYEHINPEKVGNRQRILVSDLSGVATVFQKAKEFGIELKEKSPEAKELLQKLKEMENQGYQFEGAEASFEMLIRKFLGQYKPYFELHDFKVTDKIRISDEEDEATSQAEIHLSVEGKEEKSKARGVGPVHALDRALRKAMERFYPRLTEIQLVDYKVRVLPSGEGTASYVRVLIECRDADSKWATVGVSENLIQASYLALVDSLDYKLMKDKS